MADPANTTEMPGNRGCVACGAINGADAVFCARCGATLPLLGEPARSKSAHLLDDARQHLTLQHWEEAALAAEAALVLEPASAEAHHIAAVARLKQGMRSSAIRHAEAAVQLDGANPEYHATLLLARGDASQEPPVWTQPVFIAAGAAVLVLILVVWMLSSILSGRNAREAQNPVNPTTPTGDVSPFATTTAPGEPYPQPSRPTGTPSGPRIPARGTAPGPSDLSGETMPAAGSAPIGSPVALPSVGPSAAVGLSPAPVDATMLNRFGNPEPSTTSPAPTPRASVAPRTRTVPPVVEPPSAEPGGGTLFGGSGFGPAGTAPSTAGIGQDGDSTAAPAPVPPRAQASPQQSYVDRDYSAAIAGYLKRIDNGEDTGANFQQLGLAYERVGDRANAVAAYNRAIRAYRAQMQSGSDTEIASRGLRATQRALQMLESR